MIIFTMVAGLLTRHIFRKVCVLLCVIAPFTGFCQTSSTYLVLFKDKKGTPFQTGKPEAFLTARAIERRERQNIPIRESDLPVNPDYLSKVAGTGAQVWFTSKWFNGAVVSATESQLHQIAALPFYAGIERKAALSPAGKTARLASGKSGSAAPIDYGAAKQQIEMLGVQTLHQLGYTGAGLLIGVFDSGFRNADQQGYLKHLFDHSQITDTYDFISRNKEVYDDDTHGLQVLSVLASKQPGTLVGPAFDADYVLYRTENVSSETPYEEVTWLLAAERADSVGVDIINTSLGYNTFDDSAFDYSYAQMNGKTAVISRAARFAARTGMLLAVAAGNEGAGSWKYITAPADVDSVLSVGAVNAAEQRYALSSFGPNSEGVIKPDVAALGSGVRVGSVSGSVVTSQGTSFATPLVAGLAALLWQQSPDQTAQELMERIRRMGNQAGHPDNELGYGIPFYSDKAVPAVPEQLTTTLKNNLVTLSWVHQADAQTTGYEISRSRGDEPFVTIATVSQPLYNADTLLETGSYRYRVRALAGEQKSGYVVSAALQFTIAGLEMEIFPARLHPNPATEKITLRLGETYKNERLRIEILTAAGTVRLRQELTLQAGGEAPVSIKNLQPGLYLLRISSGTGPGTVLKFIKQ